MVRGAANDTNFTVVDYAEHEVESILNSFFKS